ncbi:MAG: NifU family protein [Saprospiraceae bacterium]|nr:NifU family protein [Saprospiraceae bacterium]
MEDLLVKVESALDEIRPHLHVDGGDIEVVEIIDNSRLIVRWLGNCGMCTMSAMTLKGGVEQVLKHRVPEITSIEVQGALVE